MRLRVFTAATITEAMEQVRTALGDDAIIVSTEQGRGGRGVEITAAVEDDAAEDAQLFEVADGDRLAEDGGPPERDSPAETVAEAMDYHGVPARLAERVLRVVRNMDAETAAIALASALDCDYRFQPLTEPAPHRRPIALVGPPGSGKTLTIAKLAARHTIAGRPVAVITTDTRRAGAVDQLAAFTRVLKIRLRAALNAKDLRQAVANCPSDALVLIDSPATNPYSADDRATQAALLKAVKAEPVLVLGAGGDPLEAVDVVDAFAQIGATRLILTRTDTTRRLGAALAAADAGRLAFAEIGVSNRVAEGLSVLDAHSLARLLLPRTAAGDARPTAGAAASDDDAQLRQSRM